VGFLDPPPVPNSTLVQTLAPSGRFCTVHDWTLVFAVELWAAAGPADSMPITSRNAVAASSNRLDERRSLIR
jgi:hypothetical protein